MDILVLLAVFFILATVIKIATDNTTELLTPWIDFTRYKLVVALVLTLFGVFGLNLGVLEALDVPLGVSRSWFHWFDLTITSLFLTTGAQVIHRLDEAWKQYQSGGGSND